MWRSTLFLLGAVLIGFSTVPEAAAGDFFKCMIDGRVVYQASPCPKGVSGGAVVLKPITSLGGMPGSAPGSAASSTPSPGSGAARNDGSWYSGAPGYRLALAESKRTGAPVFVYFHTDWCGYCKQVDSKVFPDPKVAEKLRRFIKVKINPELNAEDDGLFRSLGGNGFPFALAGKGSGGLARFSFGDYQPETTLSGLSSLLK